MPTFKFRETVERIAKDRELPLYDSHDDLLRQIEKDLEDKIITAEDTTERLKENKDFRLKFTGDDFKEIVDATK